MWVLWPLVAGCRAWRLQISMHTYVCRYVCMHACIVRTFVRTR